MYRVMYIIIDDFESKKLYLVTCITQTNFTSFDRYDQYNQVRKILHRDSC